MSRSFARGGRSRGHQGARENLTRHARDNRANQLNPTHPAYWAARGHDMSSHDAQLAESAQSGSGSWQQRMTAVDAARIQSRADRTDTNQEFKARAQSAATKNAD